MGHQQKTTAPEKGDFKPCDCNYGKYWFHTSSSAGHEYNRNKYPQAKYHKDRKPEAGFYGHIDEKKAVAWIKGEGGYKSFLYSGYQGTFADKKNQAFADCAKYIKEKLGEKIIQAELF